MQINLQRFRRLLSKPRQILPNGEARPLPRKLPVEILLSILSYCNTSDLSNLCRASRTLRDLVEVLLYRKLDLRLGEPRQPKQYVALHPLDQRKQGMLRRALRTPHLSSLVVEFKVAIRWCSGDYRTIHKSGARYSRCDCSRVDTLLGQALKSLINLRVLHIKCSCCRVLSEVYRRHTYLEKLRTSALQELSFQCRCMPFDTEPFRPLIAPCLSSVETLRWDLCWRRGVDPPYRALYKPQCCLPSLSRLMCDDYELVSPVICRRSVTHVNATQPRSLLSAIENSAPSFRNIQHLGFFSFAMTRPDTILAAIKVLVDLPNLQSLEIQKYFAQGEEFDESHPYYSSSSDKLIRDLHREHVNLRKVYVSVQKTDPFLGLVVPEYWIWELEELWHGRRTPVFTSWDIIHDRC